MGWEMPLGVTTRGRELIVQELCMTACFGGLHILKAYQPPLLKNVRPHKRRARESHNLGSEIARAHARVQKTRSEQKRLRDSPVYMQSRNSPHHLAKLTLRRPASSEGGSCGALQEG